MSYAALYTQSHIKKPAISNGETLGRTLAELRLTAQDRFDSLPEPERDELLNKILTLDETIANLSEQERAIARDTFERTILHGNGKA